MRNTTAAKTANLSTPVTSILEMSHAEFDGFEADEIPETFTTEAPSTQKLLALSTFLVVAPASDEALALDAAEIAAVARDYATFPMFLSSTGKPAPTVERLSKESKCTIFLTTRETSEKDLHAVSGTVAALRAVGVTARTYSVPIAHASASDWLLSVGSKRVNAALNAAAERAIGRAEDKELEGGYIPLGYTSAYWVWSIDHAEVQRIPTGSLDRSALLISAAGRSWLEARYPKKDNKGIINDFDNRKAAGDLRDACAKLKSFKSDRICLSGVFKEKGEYVVNSSDCWYAADGAPVKRTGERVFARGRDLGVTQDTKPATVADGQNVLGMLKTFNWARKEDFNNLEISTAPRFSNGKDTDALMMLGTLYIMYLCASLTQRPPLFIHADPGSGKSVLLRFASQMLGSACLASVGSSGAGIMAKLASEKASIAVILDESGYDSKHINSIAEFLKLGYGGGQKNMSNAEQGVVEFKINTLALIAGTIPPSVDAQIDSRMLVLQQHPWPKGERPPVHELFVPENRDNEKTKELGLRMFARALESAPRYERAVAMLHSILGIDGRPAETLVPSIAGSFCALHDEEMDEKTAIDWLELFEIEEDKKRLENVSIADEFMHHIMSSSTSMIVDEKPISLTVGDLCARASEDTPKGAYRQSLGMIGLKVMGDSGVYSLGIAGNSHGFKKHMADSKWAKANLANIVKSLPGASKAAFKGSFAGCPEYFHSFALEFPEEVEF